MMELLFSEITPSPLQRIQTGFMNMPGPKVFIKREDLLDSPLQGNKFRKLKYNLLHALAGGFDEIVSFGGAYSNHVHALSYVPQMTGLGVSCYIRGEIDDIENPTLGFARENGVRLIPLTRQSYKLRHDEDFQHTLMRRHPGGYLLPEGGTNTHALKGVEECAREISDQLGADPTVCMVPAGSGGTMAGLISGFEDHVRIIGIAAFAGEAAARDIQGRIGHLTGFRFKNWELDSRFHYGGFARMTPDLLDLTISFREETGILLDPVYTCKMIAAFRDRWISGDFSADSTIVLVHTGGIQGWDGFRQRFGKKYDPGNIKGL